MFTPNAREIRNLKRQIEAATARGNALYASELAHKLARGLANNRLRKALAAAA